MATVDFSQEARCQGCLHIALKSIGDDSVALVKAVGRVLRDMPPVQLPESKGTVLFLRFVDGDELPCWAVSGGGGTGGKVRRWDQFSAYKSLLGLLCVAQCHDVDDLDNIRAGYKDCIKAHQHALCSSRCLVYGPKKNFERCTELKDGMVHVDCTVDELDVLPEDIQPPTVERVAGELAQGIFIKLRAKMEECQRVIGDPSRVELPHLKTPMECREQSEEEAEQRQLSRNHLLGRLQKQLADLYLLIGQLQRAGQWYRTAYEELRHHRDWLWVGGAYEGLSVTAIMTKECERVLGQKAQGVDAPSALSKLKGKARGAAAFSSGGSVISNQHRAAATIEPRKNKATPSRAPRPATTVQRPPTNKSPSPEPEQYDSLVISNRNDDLGIFMEGDNEVDGEMEDLKKEEEGTLALLVDSRLLHKDFIVDRFNLAISSYRKAGNLGSIPHMEALLKFSKYLVEQKRYGKAADALQKMLKIEGTTPLDQLSLYRTMASIYHTIGFHRKAAMYKFYAARHANKIAKSNQTQLLHQAHELLLSSLPGYKLSSELECLPETMASHRGWPELQASVLTDFVHLSRKLGENLVVIKHTCYLLQVLHQHMEMRHLRGISFTVEQVIKEAMEQCITSPKFAQSAAGKLISPIPLTQFPLVHSFYPRPLIKMMAPLRRDGFTPNSSPEKEAALKKVVSAENPFIYSPFAPGKKKKGNKRAEVLWVDEDPAEMALTISNPLPFELRVENMALVMEGSKVEIFPSSLTLPGKSEKSQFVLVNIPHETGVVSVLGYEAKVFGVHHKCHVKIPGNPIIRVIPKLPLLQARSFPLAAEATHGERRMSKAGLDKFDLLDGESCQFVFELVNVGAMDINAVTAVIKKYNDKYCQFSWDKDSLAAMLPLSPTKSSSLCVSVQASMPSGSRVIGDTIASTRPALFHETGAVVPLELTPPVGMSSGRTTPTYGNTTPNHSPVIKRGRQSILTHRRKASNEGLDRSNTERRSSKLMDSLNLDTPLDLLVDNHGNTLPSFGRSSGSSGSAHKSNSLMRSKKSAKGFQKRMGPGLDYDDVVFGLDKRASIRSDPGDRDKGKFRSLKFTSGSSHTSPTSSFNSIPSDPSLPIAIPHTAHTTEHDGGSGSSDSFGRSVQGLARNSQGNKGSKGRTIAKMNISLPKGPLYKESPKKVKVVGEFVFEYSGGEGAELGYYRESEANVSVVVRPCLLFEKFDISSSDKSQELFQFSFVVHNISSLKLRVTIKVNQAGLEESGGTPQLTKVIDTNFSKKCSVLVKKFNLDSDTSDNPGTKTEIHAIKQYSKKLQEMLTIHWEEEGEKEEEASRSGMLTLDGLHLPVTNVSLMKPFPILFSVMLNQQVCSPMETAHSQQLRVGSLMRTCIKLTNNSPSPFPVSLLILEPYTFSQEGRSIVRNLNGRMLHSGNLVTSVPKLPPGGWFEHEVCMSFLYRGHYLLDIKTVVPNATLKAQSEPALQPGVTRSPIKKTQHQPPRPPPLELDPPVEPSSPESPPVPSSPLTPQSTSPPPTSARALVRKFEMEFASKREAQIPLRRNHSNKSKSTPPKTSGTPPKTNGTPPTTSGTPPKTSRTPPKTSGTPPKTSETPPTTSGTLPKTSPVPPVKTIPSVVSPPTSGNTPPPVPTSNRPTIGRTASTGAKSSSPSTEELRKNRSYTAHVRPVVVVKPSPISSSSSSDAPPSSASVHDSSSSSSSLKSAVTTITTSTSLAISVHSAPTNSASTSLKSQSSVLLTSQSKYQHLLRDRSQSTSSARVTSGPNFSFYVV